VPGKNQIMVLDLGSEEQFYGNSKSPNKPCYLNSRRKSDKILDNTLLPKFSPFATEDEAK
jgi:hypothetical protein